VGGALLPPRHLTPLCTTELGRTCTKSSGRNLAEILRAPDALQATDRAPISMPAERTRASASSWRRRSRPGTPERFKDVDEVRPYLRFADAPASVAVSGPCRGGSRCSTTSLTRPPASRAVM
jgi:hypothetical protein